VKITVVSDIAGRVTRDSAGADRITVAGVSLPTGAISQIRRKIPKFQPKWRNATAADLSLILKIIQSESISIAVRSAYRDPVAWGKFWDSAAAAHLQTAPLTKGRMSFVKAATVIKYWLFIEAVTYATAHAVKIGSIIAPAGRRRPMLIQRNLVFDSDIDGPDNIEVFEDNWKGGDGKYPLTESLGITMETTGISLTTEQQEPLLLLADYVAGIAHAMHSNSRVLSASSVSQAALEAVYASLRQSKKYVELLEPFDLQYEHIFPDFAHFFQNKS
jgi:hypothetical protein